MNKEFSIDPLDIFNGPDMPDSYKYLAEQDLLVTLIHQFPKSFNVDDVLTIQSLEPLPLAERTERLKRAIESLSNREVSGANQAVTQAQPRMRISL